MGLRYRKSIKLSKGVKLNFGKTGMSVTVGRKGMHHTIHTSGRRTTSVGIPGTGLSYVSTSGGKRSTSSKRRYASSATNVQQQMAVQQQRDAEYQKNVEMVNDFDELIDQIRSIHEECSETVNWIELQELPEPFNPNGIGPFELEARQAMDESKPGLFGRIIPLADKKRVQALESALYEAREKDQEMYAEWVELKRLASKVLSGDIDSYFFVVSEMHPFDEILDFGSDFDIGTDSPDRMEVEFHAKTSKVVPNHVLSLTPSGRLSSRQMTKTMHYDIAQDYICSCTLRIARDMFALLPIEKVIIHVVDTIQPMFGEAYDDTVLSVLIDRNHFEGIDFDAIDPSDTIETFECNMNFKKTQGLKPVARIEFC